LSENKKSKISYVQVLRRQGYRQLFFGSAVSIIGNQIQYIALIAYVYHITGKALDLGLLMIISALPNLIFGPVMGVLADRYNRRSIMIISDISRFFIVLMFPLTQTLWQIYLLVFLMGIARAAYSPSEFAYIPNLVTRDELVVANSLEMTMINVTMIVGPALGGLIIGRFNTTVAFIINAITFLFSAVMIMMIREEVSKRKVETNKTNILQDLKFGLRFMWSDKIIRFLIVVFSILILLTSGINPLVIVYNHEILGKGDAEFGYLISMIGFGGIVGGFIYGLIGRRYSKIQIIFYNLVIDGVILALLGFNSSYLLAMVIFFLLGLLGTIFEVAIMTLLQEYIPDELRGRIIGIFSLVFDPFRMVSMGIYGFLTDLFGVGILFIASGIFEMGTGAIVRLFPAYKKMRRIEEEGVVKIK